MAWHPTVALSLLTGLGVAVGFYNVYRVAKPKGPLGGKTLDRDA